MLGARHLSMFAFDYGPGATRALGPQFDLDRGFYTCKSSLKSSLLHKNITLYASSAAKGRIPCSKDQKVN